MNVKRDKTGWLVKRKTGESLTHEEYTEYAAKIRRTLGRDVPQFRQPKPPKPRSLVGNVKKTPAGYVNRATGQPLDPEETSKWLSQARSHADRTIVVRSERTRGIMTRRNLTRAQAEEFQEISDQMSGGHLSQAEADMITAAATTVSKNRAGVSFHEALRILKEWQVGYVNSIATPFPMGRLYPG